MVYHELSIEDQVRMQELESPVEVIVRPREITVLGIRRFKRTAWLLPRNRYVLELPKEYTDSCIDELEILRGLTNVEVRQT